MLKKNKWILIASSIVILLPMLLGVFGFAFLPESFVGGHIARGRFKEIKIKDLDSSRNNYLIIHKNRRLNAIQESAYLLMKEM